MKKQILLCTVSPLFPLASGGKIYTANTVLPLAKEYDYHLLTFVVEQDKEIIKKYEKEYKRYFKSCNFVDRPLIPLEKNRSGKLKHFAQHIFKRLPLMDVSYYSHEAVKVAKGIIEKYNIDILELHNLHTAYLKKEFPDIPALLMNQNIEGDIFPFWEPHVENKFKKIIWKYIISNSRKNTHDVEIENLYKFEVKTFISLTDMNRVNKEACKCYHLPMAFEKKDVKNKKNDGKVRALWMGGFGWYPNEEGVCWFVDNIYPELIKNDLSNIEIHFIGSNPPQKLENIHDNKKFFVHGWVESIEEYLDVSDLLIVPLLSGGGVRVKIIEALSMGIAVLSTSKGCEGLGLVDGKDILIRNDPAEFAKELIEIANSPDKLQGLADKGKDYIEKHHNLQTCLKTKREIYELLVNRKI